MVDPDEDQQKQFCGGHMSLLSLIISIELSRGFWKRWHQVFGIGTAEELLDLKF
jgi:hypothetical protein